jgi:hypothetical protein
LEMSQRGDSTIVKHPRIWIMLDKAWRAEGILHAHELWIRKVPYVVHAATIAPEFHWALKNPTSADYCSESVGISTEGESKPNLLGWKCKFHNEKWCSSEIESNSKTDKGTSKNEHPN